MSSKPNPINYAGYWMLQFVVTVVIGGFVVWIVVGSTRSIVLGIPVLLVVFAVIGLQLFRNIGYYVEDYVEYRVRRADGRSSENQRRRMDGGHSQMDGPRNRR